MPAQQTRLMTLHALTFLHPGTGQSTGVVDLPIQREVHTGFPMIASSGIKGALRERAEQEWHNELNKVCTIFGPKDSEAAAALAITDARTLAFPVRSLQNVFVWITCPMVIKRLQRDLQLAGINLKEEECDLSGLGQVENAGDRAITPSDGLTGTLMLEEIKFTIQENNDNAAEVADAIAELLRKLANEFDSKRLAVVSNESFSYLVQHATQVSARIALNEKKTTTGNGGNLWYEETLPPETIMYSLLLANEPRYKPDGTAIDSADKVVQEMDKLLNDKNIQLGGNETVGQGWCGIKLAPSSTLKGEPA